jgi:transposase-like protein
MRTAALNHARPMRGNLKAIPASVLPAQLGGGFTMGAHLQPEKRLMLAVLEDAVAVYLREAHRPGRGSPDFVAACAWLQSRDGTWPFSFVAICRALGLEPSAIRRGLRAWRVRQLALPPEQRMRTRSPFRRMSGTRTKTCARSPGVSPAPVRRAPVARSA